MWYKRIDIEGRNCFYAQLRRESGGSSIEVELHTPTLNRTYYVPAESPSFQWSIAEFLRVTLDGRRGANADIRAYFGAIERLAGQERGPDIDNSGTGLRRRCRSLGGGA